MKDHLLDVYGRAAIVSLSSSYGAITLAHRKRGVDPPREKLRAHVTMPLAQGVANHEWRRYLKVLSNPCQALHARYDLDRQKPDASGRHAS